MKRNLLLFGVVLLFLFSLTQTIHAENQLTKGDVVRKARLGTGLEPSDSIATEAIRCAMDFIQSIAAYPVCIDTQRVSLSANTEMYALPSDCYKPIMVYGFSTATTDRCLDWTNPWDKGKVPDATTVSVDNLGKVWTIQDDSVKFLGFQPVPTASDSVELLYEVNATKVVFGSGANSQRIRIRECYHPALVAAVKSYLYERYERYDKSKFFLEKATFLINAAERKLSIPPIDLLMTPRTYIRP